MDQGHYFRRAQGLILKFQGLVVMVFRQTRMAGCFVYNVSALMWKMHGEGVPEDLDRPIDHQSSILDVTFIEPVCAISPWI
jgi:hypothetical protein